MTQERGTWEEIKRIRSCGVYFFPDAVYVVALARTVPGFEIHSEPVLKVNRDAGPACFGDAVVAALDSYRLDIDPPDPRSKNVGPLLKRTGLRSWKQLEKKAVHVSVSLDRGKVQVIPSMRDRQHGGYAYRPDLACECAPTPGEIGATMLRALECCS
jgi:hypothetical protein